MEPLNIIKHKGDTFRILSQTDKVQVGVMTIEPGGDSGPEEIHQADQIIYIIEGRAEVELDNYDFTLQAGHALIIPAGSQHHIQNKTDGTLFFMTIYAPPEY